MLRRLLWIPTLVLLAAARWAPPPDYRGFSPGMEYRDFAARARALSTPDALRCNTSSNTAELMECGVMIADPSDGAHFYLSAYVINGLVAMVSFGDSGDVRLVAHAQQDLERRFGPAHHRRPGSWEWRTGRRVARLTWTARGSARWIYVNLSDYDLVDGISRYVKRAKS
jgi:hypothetical protein